MRRSSAVPFALPFSLLALATAACAGILGIPDVVGGLTDDDGGPGTADAAGPADRDAGGDPDARSEPDAGDGAVATDAARADAADAGDAAVVDASCVANFATDPAHCGRCNHSCLGGPCVAGLCKPFALAENLDAPYGIAVDGTHVYVAVWGSDSIGRLDKNTPGNLEILTTGASATGPNPTVVALDDAAVYWNSRYEPGGSIRKCAKTGCAGLGQTLLSLDMASSVAVDGTRVFFTSINGDVGSADKTTGLAVTRLQDQTVAGVRGPELVVVDATQAFWSNSSAFPAMRAPRATPDGGAVEMTPDNEAAPFGRGIAVDGTRAYFTIELYDNGAVPRAGFVRAVAKNATKVASTLLADLQPNPHAIIVDDAFVTWTNLGTPVPSGGNDTYPNGSVMRCAVGGCGNAPTPIATGQKEPRGLAQDATAIYWSQAGVAVNTGAVWKLAK